MPDETDRKTSMRRITDPSGGGGFVDVKVIDEIIFVERKNEQAWESVYTITNKATNNGRKVRIQTIAPSNLQVERILQWGTVENKVLQAQESRFEWTGDKQEPPVHLKTHNFIVSNPNNAAWTVTVQRIDKFEVVDNKDQAYVSIFSLNNPDDDMTNPSDLYTDDDGTSINPPWRLDPFQDIIDASFGGVPTWAHVTKHGVEDTVEPGFPDFDKYYCDVALFDPKTGLKGAYIAHVPTGIAIPELEGVWFLVNTQLGGTPGLSDGDANLVRHYTLGHGSHSGLLEEDFRGVSVSVNCLALDIATDAAGNAYILYSDSVANTTTLAMIDREHKQVQWSIPAGSYAANSGGVAVDGFGNIFFSYAVASGPPGSCQFVLMDQNQHVLWSVERTGLGNGCCIGLNVNVSPFAPAYIISYFVENPPNNTTTVESLDGAHGGEGLWIFTGDATTMPGSPQGSLDCDTSGNVFAGFGLGTWPGNVVILDPHSGSLIGNYDVESLPGPFLSSVGNNWQATEDGVAITVNSTGLPGPQPDPADPGNPDSNERVPSVIAAQNSAQKYNVVAIPGENWPGETLGWLGSVKHGWRVPIGQGFDSHNRWTIRPEAVGEGQTFEGWFQITDIGGLMAGLPGGSGAWRDYGHYFGPHGAGPPTGGYIYPGVYNQSLDTSIGFIWAYVSI